MKSLKDKMYNYEVTPPSDSWQIISTALDGESAYPMKKKNTFFYLGLTAAAVAILIFSVFIFFDNSDKMVTGTLVQSSNNRISDANINQNAADDKITVPKTNEMDNNLISHANENKYNRELDNSGSEPGIKKYITISGPQGQPVKISAKVASLIVSSDDQYPPNAVWSDKVKKWKDIMKANTLAPTTANFLDIVELTHALKINNSTP
ncbi:MAG: hypothetical protein ABIO55_16385 [Ginsengibacter sp.]